MNPDNKLESILRSTGPYLFYDFLRMFCKGYFNYYEDETGIRIYVHWTKEGTGLQSFYDELRDHICLRSEAGSIRYIFSRATDLSNLTKQYNKFLNLKAFL